jgi:hypothetical protein
MQSFFFLENVRAEIANAWFPGGTSTKVPA